MFQNNKRTPVSVPAELPHPAPAAPACGGATSRLAVAVATTANITPKP